MAAPASSGILTTRATCGAARGVWPRDAWPVRDRRLGDIDWETYEANLLRIDSNTRPKAHEADREGPAGRAGKAVREGPALL